MAFGTVKEALGRQALASPQPRACAVLRTKSKQETTWATHCFHSCCKKSLPQTKQRNSFSQLEGRKCEAKDWASLLPKALGKGSSVSSSSERVWGPSLTVAVILIYMSSLLCRLCLSSSHKDTGYWTQDPPNLSLTH